ncbi:lyase family protein [Nocardioides sp. GY 10127]|uniref:lyase family protein n=1 Tax=Nocardioides sp. GY 10127 TaxID=2569762 RepID=UPI0010A85F51|nr:lyase family protein [Nocardioides sp. GY 10127]TIC81780.1 3-carboxy-cis,cis-muconate cycloisomerase [Nocardioides sp. GY 10127]
MTSLFWPGDHRAGGLLGDEAYCRALVEVEAAWLDALVSSGLAPDTVGADAGRAVRDLTDDVLAQRDALAEGAESGGNPVIGLVALLRERLSAGPAGRTVAATWLHRGLTSQDVVDTALVLCSRDAVDAVVADVEEQVVLLAELAAEHRGSLMAARTLTQHAVPTTFGVKAAGWLVGVLDARDRLAALRFPVQLGGAGGTLSGLVELAGRAAGEDPAARARLARDVRQRFADALGLEAVAPWHTTRGPVTALGDAAVAATDAWGRIARDVLVLTRPEVGELALAATGGSSTMPQKANPTLAVLVRRTALVAPGLAATLHLAAADQVDERADGAWHAEWATLADLLRRTVVAGAEATALLEALEVRADVMAERALGAADALTAEQRGLAGVAGHEPVGPYLGLAEDLVDEVLRRAHRPTP